MKKVMMTAACFVLGGMLTASMAGGEGCNKGKKKCGGEKDGEGVTASCQIDAFTVYCGGGEGKGKCGGEKKEG